jgi:hypothetical protein
MFVSTGMGRFSVKSLRRAGVLAAVTLTLGAAVVPATHGEVHFTA